MPHVKGISPFKTKYQHNGGVAMIRELLKNAVAKVAAALRIFLGTDKPKEIKKKAMRLAVLVPAFRVFDWSMVLVGGAITVALKEFGLGNLTIFMLLWLGYVIQARVEIFANDKFAQDDITLMEGLRRWINVCFEISLARGILAETLAFTRVAVWDGAGCMAILYRPLLPPSRVLRIFLLIAFAGIHMFIWFQLYLLGYNSVFAFLKDKVF